MDIVDEELLRLWQAFHENRLKYLLIGEFAAVLHSHSRLLPVMGIWIEDSHENRRRLREFMKMAEMGDFEILESMDFIPGWTTFRLMSGMELDIMTY